MMKWNKQRQRMCNVYGSLIDLLPRNYSILYLMYNGSIEYCVHVMCNCVDGTWRTRNHNRAQESNLSIRTCLDALYWQDIQNSKHYDIRHICIWIQNYARFSLMTIFLIYFKNRNKKTFKQWNIWRPEVEWLRDRFTKGISKCNGMSMNNFIALTHQKLANF